VATGILTRCNLFIFHESAVNRQLDCLCEGAWGCSSWQLCRPVIKLPFTLHTLKLKMSKATQRRLLRNERARIAQSLETIGWSCDITSALQVLCRLIKAQFLVI
jgi:hypothetical protein